jgi:hypothetical protein
MSSVDSSPTTNRKSNNKGFDERLLNFKRGCDKVLDDYLTPYIGTMYASSIFADEGVPSDLYIHKTKMYAKLQGRIHNGLQNGYTFAIVELISGDVYRPSSALDGSLNRSTATIRGNIFDKYNGLRCVYSGGPQEYVGD